MKYQNLVCKFFMQVFISNIKLRKRCKLGQFVQQHRNVFPKKSCTLAGLEPGSSVPQAVAMTTVPRRQGIAKSCPL
jgi:hypothetical protein